MIMNIVDLTHIMKDVIAKVDHKNLDLGKNNTFTNLLDVPYFFDKVSTTENLAVYLWRELTPKLHNMYEIKIQETDKNSVTYRGD
jgi:6-pyruvoyltetrahydropterin/6-carboxytetrahydropterin synthase